MYAISVIDVFSSYKIACSACSDAHDQITPACSKKCRHILPCIVGVCMPCITSFIGQFVAPKERTSAVGFVVAGTYGG